MRDGQNSLDIRGRNVDWFPAAVQGVYGLPPGDFLVEAMGLEPTNLLTASQALYQLSYAPRPVGHVTSRGPERCFVESCNAKGL